MDTSIWKLPSQPLPGTEVKGPVFVTTWFFLFFGFSIAFGRIIRLNPGAETTRDFHLIFIGVVLLTLWYLIIVIDRWLHFDHTSVPYGYVLLVPIWETLRVASTVLMLWGTFRIVWREVESSGRFSPEHQRRWALAAQITIFLVAVVSLFFILLNIGFTVAWLLFLSLNAIADIASRRTQFEVSMTALFFGLALLTVLAAIVALFRARVTDGTIRKTRLALLVATNLLLAREAFEFAITLMILGSAETRQSVKLSVDIAFGLLTTLYLGMVGIHAWTVSSGHDRGGHDAQALQSDLRKKVLNILHNTTNGAQIKAEPIGNILDQILQDLPHFLANGSVGATTTDLDQGTKRELCEAYLRDLKVQLAHLGARDPTGGMAPRSASAVSSIFGRMKGKNVSSVQVHAVPSQSSLRSTPTPSFGKRPQRVPVPQTARWVPTESHPEVNEDIEINSLNGRSSVARSTIARSDFGTSQRGQSSIRYSMADSNTVVGNMTAGSSSRMPGQAYY